MMLRWLAAGLFLSACAAAGFMGASGLPAPRGDDAFYKAPGVELIQTGRFASPSATGYLPYVEEIFAAYPPLYPLCFAGWTAAFGFSIETAALFNHALHLIGVVMMSLLAARLLAGSQTPSVYRTVLILCMAVVHFGNLRFFDRQEELAGVLIWLECLLALRATRNRPLPMAGACVVSGLLVGSAACVGPWPGMTAAAIASVRLLLAGVVRTDGASAARNPPAEQPHGVFAALTRILWTGATALIPVGGWVCVMELMRPGAVLEQFRAHVGKVPHVSVFVDSQAWIFSWTYAPYQLPFLFLGLMSAPRVLGWPRSAEGRQVAALLFVGLASIAFAGLWRADSYVYLWMGLFLIHPCVPFALCRLIQKTQSRGERALLAGFALLTAAVALRDPVSLVIQAAQFPAIDRPAAVFAELHRRIPLEDLVATTPAFWHAFQGRNRWRQTATLPSLREEQRLEWDWIVLPSRYGGEAYRNRLLNGFDLVDVRPMSFEPFAPTFVGPELGWGYELYRNRRNQKQPRALP